MNISMSPRPFEVHGASDAKREIHETARLGFGCYVWNFATILADVVIGNYCSVGSCTEIGRGSVVGDRSRISAQVFLPPRSQVGNNVFIGPGAVFTDDRHPVVSLARSGYVAEPPVIEDFASIGAGAVICPGVRIGARARVAAGAIVTKDVPPGEHVRCEPARPRALSEQSARRWA